MIPIQFNRVSSNKLYIQIYDQILSQIQTGAFAIGDKLPTERELCAQFGVSRAPIRQALSALEMKGYIYSRQGEGVYVKSTQVPAESQPGETFLDSISPEDIVEARMNIEPLIARYAAERATDEDIEALRTTIKRMEQETEKGSYVPETDERLHMEIARASHNDLFIQFMTVITQAMKQQEMWKFIRDRTVTRPDYRDTNFSEHEQIIHAIENHQDEAAARLMTTHMQNLYDRYWKD
ncbi:FadR/GntR family transcriptional regulator [Paenibacillus terreus]|uniref:FadR/GntR family transcriptional regulator n=1 Tax=Paenibacillus terreus TaxID=1387834 RepID=A0ABV5BDI8_9BACL